MNHQERPDARRPQEHRTPAEGDHMGISPPGRQGDGLAAEPRCQAELQVGTAGPKGLPKHLRHGPGERCRPEPGSTCCLRQEPACRAAGRHRADAAAAAVPSDADRPERRQDRAHNSGCSAGAPDGFRGGNRLSLGPLAVRWPTFEAAVAAAGAAAGSWLGAQFRNRQAGKKAVRAPGRAEMAAPPPLLQKQ